MNLTIEGLTSAYRVAARIGISYRQLDYWVRCGYVSCERGTHGSGSARRFSVGDVRCVVIMKELLSLGVGREVSSRAVTEFRERQINNDIEGYPIDFLDQVIVLTKDENLGTWIDIGPMECFAWTRSCVVVPVDYVYSEADRVMAP